MLDHFGFKVADLPQSLRFFEAGFRFTPPASTADAE